MMNRLISLSVGTKSDEDYARTFQDISELANNLGVAHDYVRVSASVVGGDLDEEDAVVCDREHLHYDEETLNKVHMAVVRKGFTAKTATELIGAIQNAGILFRERCDEEKK